MSQAKNRKKLSHWQKVDLDHICPAALRKSGAGPEIPISTIMCEIPKNYIDRTSTLVYICGGGNQLCSAAPFSGGRSSSEKVTQPSREFQQKSFGESFGASLYPFGRSTLMKRRGTAEFPHTKIIQGVTMGRNARKFRSLILAVAGILAINWAIAEASSTPVTSKTPSLKASGVPCTPSYPRPKASGVPCTPSYPRPKASGVPCTPSYPRP